MRIDILEKKQEILQWIAECQPKAFICKQLQCKPSTLNDYLQKMEIEYEGNKGRKGLERTASESGYKTAEEYIKSTCVKSHILKQKLLRDGIKEYKCEKCGLSEWLNEPIPLELHHIDGNHYNNNFDNLLLLCPTCHAKENNNSGKGRKTEVLKTNQCIDCGKEISKGAQRCKSCAAKQRQRVVENRPTREELKDLIRNKPFLQIAKDYNVSDNAIRKWCDGYNLPRQKTEINKYSDEDWAKI